LLPENACPHRAPSLRLTYNHAFFISCSLQSNFLSTPFILTPTYAPMPENLQIKYKNPVADAGGSGVAYYQWA
jgi:hypothetical protein